MATFFKYTNTQQRECFMNIDNVVKVETSVAASGPILEITTTQSELPTTIYRPEDIQAVWTLINPSQTEPTKPLVGQFA